jgi:class 3 adenylate cyclase
MRIACSYHGTQKIWETPETEVLFGRAEDKRAVILDLSADQKVSRLHGRIWEEEGTYWIEDLNSSRGTKLNGIEIKGKGRQPLRPGDSVIAGETTLQIEIGETTGGARRTHYLDPGTFLLPEKPQAETSLTIEQDMASTVVGTAPPESAPDDATRRLKVVHDLPFQFATKTKQESLLPEIVDQLMEVIPNGESWALVLRESGTNDLLVAAYHYVRQPFISEPLIRRAMIDRKAFIWKKGAQAELSDSMRQSDFEIGMYAPLIWQDEALGAICVGVGNVETYFNEEDLRLTVATAHYAAMAVATLRLREKLCRQSISKNNLMRQFPPKVAERLLAHRKRLRLAGQRSEVTILNSRIQDSLQLAKELDPVDVMEMLNDYFAAVVPVVFKYGGTIDKCAGDTISAVFGSPESDPSQRENAVHAALEWQTTITRLNDVRRSRRAPWGDFGIGIHCGEVVQGFVGTGDRMEFTVVGEAVARAARYSAAAAAREILISPEMNERVRESVETERTTIQAHPEGDDVAYRVNCFKDDVGLSDPSPGGR